MGEGKLKGKLALAAALVIMAQQAGGIGFTGSSACLAHGPATPVSAQDELAIGRLYYSNDDFPLAIEHFSNAIKADSQNGRLYYERGHAYYKLDQYIQAVPDYTRSISLKFSPALNYERRAYCFLNNHQIKKGIDDCTKAIEADPLSRVAYYNRAKAYALIGESDKSKKDLEKIKQLDKNPRSKDLFDRCHLTHSREERVKLCSEAVKLDPNNREAWLLLGSSYLDLNKDKEALNCFNKLVAMDSGDLTAYMNRAICEIAFNKLDAATKDLSYVINRADQCFQAYNLRGQCYVASNKIKDGQADYNRAIELINAKMATEYARKNLEYRKTLGRSLVTTYRASADAWEKLGDLPKAIENVTWAINGSRMAPTVLVELYPQRAALYKKANKIAEMHQDLQAAKAVSDKIDAIRRGPYIPPPPVSSYSSPAENSRGTKKAAAADSPPPQKTPQKPTAVPTPD
ncbi:MAG: tetratricopeptide repeat protein [Cyanobacteria bacterium SZAS TMP-1]|nr:tetratricopeptide repeat protein [Cyanobacteria bacterium SZAS TMP-1]